MIISLTDNTCNQGSTIGSLSSHNLREAQRVYGDLAGIANQSIGDLLKENPNLFVFPWVDRRADGIENLPILSMEGTRNDPLGVKIRTGNLMGFFGVGETRVRIRSRFDQGKDDYFLHYLLSKICHFNLVDLKTDSSWEDEMLRLLCYLFPRYLNAAMRKGIYRTYRSFERNDAAVKGAIDISRQIRLNAPFNEKVAYRCREFSCDNEMTELIRHTIEAIASLPFGKAIFAMNEDVRENIRRIRECTPSYSFCERSEALRKNAQPFKNGFFAPYAPLQRLCKLILQRKTMRYSRHGSEVYGILFDGAWLWEEYLWTIIKDGHFLHPTNKNSKYGIKLFEDVGGYRRYPDFYIPGKVVLDAKYKRLEKEEGKAYLGRDDIHQVISYLYVEKAMHGGIIYPIEGSETCDVVVANIGKLRGYGAKVVSYGFPIPGSGGGYSEFAGEMEEREKSFAGMLRQMNGEIVL